MKNTSRTNLLLHVLMQVKRVEVHYLNDEYIPKIALLQAFWNANISAQSNGKKNATRPAWPTVTCKDLDESCLSC